ncbi:peptidoglycan-binding protein, partial [Burkholderia cepacia]|uniref:peptidoglycan-binding domain-containing protein n=1 Tax=Burkholderia cepacia TaxID=292 RepID=UPI0013F47CCF
PHPLVVVGQTGPAVEELQCKLDRVGDSVLDLAVDRSFGPRTKGGVAAFQRREGLEVDGISGPATWAALGRPGRPTVRTGQSGAPVAELQEALNAAAAPSTPVPVDGVADEDTEGAIVAFQDDHGLTVDGKAGDSTW